MATTSNENSSKGIEASSAPSEKQRSLDALLDFVSQSNRIHSIEDVIWHAAQHTIKDLDFEDCVIYVLAEDNSTLQQAAAFGNKSPRRKEINQPITIQVGEGIVGKSAASKSMILITDTRQEPDYIVDDKLRLSELAVPIIYNNKVLGVIDSENSQINFFTKDHIRYLEILASVLATKLTFESNISALEKTITALEESKKLADLYLKISNATYNSLSEQELFIELDDIIAKQIDTDSFIVVLYEQQTQQYSYAYLRDNQQKVFFNINPEQAQFNRSLIAKVVQSQTSHLAFHSELATRAEQGQLIVNDSVPYCCLAVPFKIDENLHGAIALQSFEHPVLFSEQDEAVLNFLGQHISSAIERKFKDNKLMHQAMHDQITGLANRLLFMDRIDHAFSFSRRSADVDMAVLFIDFDDFKRVNDNYGHQTGDLLLQTAAHRMQSQLRDTDTLARLGGDEFAVLLESLENTHQAIIIARRILQVLQKPMLINNHSICITISIGIGFIDDNTQSAEDLLRNADHAMYHAKSQGENTIQVYENTLHQALLSERQLQFELISAIERQQLIFHYQPIINLKTKQLMGFEALLRWQHPKRGLIFPEDFISVAEQSDLIKSIDQQLLKSVAQQLQQWQQQSKCPIYVSINISAKRFVDSKLVEEIRQAITDFQLNPDSLVVEVTEHVLMENIGKARHLFHQLKQLGIRISLDDFGTGYSSLSYLNQLPFDIIKIDRSFVTNISEHNHELPIIKTIVALANTLNIELIAEGIESQLQFDTLSEMNCCFGQGYFFSKPLTATAATELINNADGLEQLFSNINQYT